MIVTEFGWPPRSGGEGGQVMRIALVHGAWADGSSWAAVIRRLQAAGHDVIAPQLPHTSLADNVAKLRHVLTLQAEPTVVAAHSYGRQVITHSDRTHRTSSGRYTS